MTCRITWEGPHGPCQKHGQWHACKRHDDHSGWHVCACGVQSRRMLNPKPERERPQPFYQKAHGTVPRRTRPWQRRDPSFYLPKYMKQKRGLL